MAADNISKFYGLFNQSYDDFKTENDFRGWLGNAKRQDIDNLYNLFSKDWDDFGSADDMISYLGWSEMTDEERKAAAEKQAEVQHQRDAAAGREMWNRQRASRQAPVSSVEQAPERAKAAMAEPAPAVKQTEEEEAWVPEEDEWKSYFREMREQAQGGRSTLADAPAAVQEGYAEEEKAKAEEDAREKSLAELMQMREEAAKDYEFVKEYNARQKDYEEKMRSLSSAKGDIRGKGLADYNEEKEWLDQNRYLYETAKKRVDGINQQIYRDQVPIAEEERQQLLDANKEALNDLRGHVGLSIRPLGAGTSVADEDWDEYALRNNAQGLLEEAGQVLRQGSKYDPGYEGSEFNKLYTAAKQYAGGFINNADLGSLTLGLTEGLQNSAARKVGEHYNEIINQTLKDLGLTDAQMNALMKDADGAMEKLQPLVEEMEASAAELQSMQKTLEDMVASGADRGKIEAYAKQLDQKYAAYDKRYKEEYEPLYATYKKYEDATKAVQTALDAGLSGGEEAVLDAFNFLAKARELRRDDVSTASKAGAGFEQTVEFMLDFLLTGGFSKAGTKAATKLTMRHLEKKLGKEKFGRLVAEGVLDPKRMTATMAQDVRRGLGREAVEEMAKREVINPSTWSRMVTDPLVAGARTLAMVPRNIATYGEQIAELADRDELGRYNFSRSKVDAALNTLVQNYIEYWSEGFGEYFGAAEQALFRKVTARAPKTLIGQTLKGYRGSIGQFLDHGKFNGQFNETLEEVVGSALNALAGALTYDTETEKSRIGDKEALSQFFAAENLMTLTMSFLPLSAIGAVSNIKAYNKMKTRYDAAVDNLNPLIQSGAVDLKELDGLADDLRGLTPEEATGRMVDMADKAREKNGGALPKNFVQSIMGYLEGKFAMSMENEAWEANANKVAIVDAYTRGYTAADPSAAWDAAQAENEAKKEALEAGFTEEELDNNSMTLGQQATYLQNTRPDQVERAQALENYAVAKAARESLRDGYDEQTDEMNREWADNVRDNLDHGDGITTATININGQDVPVYISGQGVSVTPEGTLTTETGPDGLVIYRTSPTAQPQTAKASAFSNAVNQETEAFIAEKQEAVKRDRAAIYDAEASTVSERGQQEAIAGKVGQTVIVTDGNGVYEPVKVERMREDGTKTVISGDRKFLQGLARRMGMQIPPGSMLDAPTAALYQLLAKEADGVTLSTQMPEGTERTATDEAMPQQGEAKATAPAVDVKGLRDQNVTINVGGQERTVHVDDVRDGTVYLSDENGNDSQMSEADFAASVQGTQAPVAEEPAPAPAPAEQGEAPAPAPAAPAVEIPTDKKGNKIYDAPGVPVEAALADMYSTPNLTKEQVDQFIAARAAKAEAARNPEMGDMSLQEWGQAVGEANRVADFWSAMAEAAKTWGQQPAAPAQAEEPAAPAQAETPAAQEAPAAEAPVAEEPAEPAQEEAAEGEEVEAQEPTREALKPYKKFVARAKKWEKRTGIKVRFFTSIDEVDDKDAREALERGEEIGGWYDPKTGGVGVYLPYNPNLAELDKTIVHEVVSHKGLRGLLGEEGYNQLLDRVWNEMMSPSQRKKFLKYNSHLRGSEEYLRRAAADEFIAQLSENVDFSDNRTMFEKIVDYIVDWFNEHFGNETPLTEEEIVEDAKARVAESRRINRNVLTNLLIDSMKLYETRTKQGKQDAETRREIGAGMTGGAMQTNEGETGQTKFSIKSIATGGGLHVIEDNGRGMVAFTTDDGRVFDAENPITAEDLQDLDNTVMAYMMEDARDITGITLEQEEVLWQAYAAQLNAFLAKGVPGDGLSGADRLKALWQWEVENSVYKSVSPNGDKQYSYSMDITRVCKKNEAVINAISAMQSEVGYGITPGQIMDIYLQGVEEGYQVPCPVCYVFSHYINNGIVATVAIRGQEKYGADLVDPSTLSEEEKAERIQMWYDRMKEERKFNEDNADEIENARQECATIIEQIDLLSQLITSGRLKGEAAKKAIRRVKDLDNRFRSALALYTQAGQAGWIKQFAIREAKKGEKGFVPKGQPKGKKGEAPKAYVLWDDTYQGFPKEYALDLRLTAETIEKYPAIQRLRNARGSAGGKEIHFASNNDIGDIPMMLGTKDGENYYQQAVLAGPGPERDRLRKAARERFASAHRYAQQQSLRGGQRMWSWSDNIERLAPDVFVNLMQLQMLGGALQAYSKQLEGVNLVASMGGYVNGSLMGYGKGWQELSDNDITMDGDTPVLSHDIKDTVTEVVDGKRVQRERFLAKAGSPVFEVMDDGVKKKVTLLFDDVVGIDAYGRERDGKHLKGLFDLNAELDKAGNILVGMNDPHVRAAMADPRVFFIIPWHASGNSVHIVQQMLSYLGVDTDIKDYTDYTDVQEEKDLMGKEVSDYVARFWEDHKNETDYACGIEGGIPSGKGGKLSEEQEHYRELRDAIFLGVKYDTGKTKTVKGKKQKVYETISIRDLADLVARIEAGEEMPAWMKADERKLETWPAQIMNDVFLSQVLRKIGDRVDEQKMTSTDRGFIYPYEYWDESSTYDTADVNGGRYLEYCRRLGVKPKFVGMLDGRPAENDRGNFANDKGYWKLLIDRRMYGVDRKFQDLDPVTTSEYDTKFVDPEWTKDNFHKTLVADDKGAKRIANKVIEKEGIKFKEGGGIPLVNYGSDRKEDLRRYKALMAATKRIGIDDLVAMATPEAAVSSANEGADADPQTTEGKGLMYRRRTAEPPKERQKVYKLMRLGDDGKLYPLFIDSGSPIELNEWWDADSPALKDVETLPSDTYVGKRDVKDKDGNKIGEEEYRYASYIVDNETGEAMSIADFKAAHKGEKAFSRMQGTPNKDAINWATENGMRWIRIEEKKTAQKRYGGSNRAYYNYGINGSNAVGTYAMRPGWHAGSLPSMRQIGKGKGKNLRDDRFVWVEGYVPADIDYNEEAQGNPDKDIPTHIPENGYYLKATNANAEASQADRIGWYVAGSFYPERIMSDSEARAVIDEWNTEHPDEKVEYDWPRESGKVFNAETMQLEDASQSRYRRVNQSQNGFISNAEAALDRIKMEKATPEQWVKMLEKEGGLKSGEDKWLGLSDWLKSQDRKSITKDEIAEFIEQNRIQIEETPYGEFDIENVERDHPGFNEAFNLDTEEFRDYPIVDSINDYDVAIEMYNREHEDKIDPNEDLSNDDYRKLKSFGDDIIKEARGRAINPTRMKYTTDGLEHKREIALTVPTIEPWNENDKIHFGDAGGGRAVAWVRFGDTTTKPEGSGLYSRGIMDELERKYGNPRAYDKMTDEDVAKAFFADYVYRGSDGDYKVYKDLFMAMDLGEERAEKVYPIFEQMVKDAGQQNNRVLVIDEIQSKRHQEGREKGYASATFDEAERITADFQSLLRSMQEKYGEKNLNEWSEEDRTKYLDLQKRAREIVAERSKVKPAPFEKNWHELAMKRMLRLAAEEGYDYVAWTTGKQQAGRYALSTVVDAIEREDAIGIPNAKGFNLTLKGSGPNEVPSELYVNDEGIVVDSTTPIHTEDDEFGVGSKLSDIVGKEMAERMMGMEEGDRIEGEEVDLGGGEGMKGFYDDILPRFMNKYGKKWGVKVSDITLPNVEEAGRVMHAVPVTQEMKESVLQGQTMFRRAGDLELDEDTKKLFDAAKERFGTTRDLREAGYVLPDGTMLDFSGRHWAKGTDTSYLNGSRQVDHRDIADLEFEEDGNTPTGIETSMSDFIRRGAIRINYPGSINLANQPTMEQASVLERLINGDNSFVRVDFGDGSRSQHYADYEDARAQRILNDIRRYFDEGVKPEGTTFSRFRRATTPDERIAEADRIMTGRTIDAMGETFGVKTNRVPRSRMPKGHETEKGYYDPSTNELTVCMDNVTDERDAVATAIHATVGYNGLSEIFGDEFNQAMVRVYASLDREGRNWVNGYIATHGLGFGDEGVIRGMEEYLSRMAEAADYGQPVWERINDVIGKSVDLLFGTEGFFFTARELNYVLRAAYQHAKNPNWLETTRGKALDRKMRRELGINETDPKRPTDPDGPGAGVRYRRMDEDSGDAAHDYDVKMKDWRTTARMELQDADLPVRIGMEKIMKETGKTTLAEDEDYVTRHNQSSSRADTEAHDFKLHHFEPLIAKVMEIQARLVGMKKDRKGRYRSRGISKDELMDAYSRIMDYMYAVSGLERNEWERAHGGEQKDWSGITSLMGKNKDEWQEAEDEARAMIGAFKAELGDDGLLDDLWDAVRDCTDYSLDHALEYGLITKSQYDELHGTDTKPRMWEYYLPLRGFKEGTAEEEYNYSSFGNVAKDGKVVREAKGRWSEAQNPIANIFHIALSEIVQGNENWAKYALYNFVQRTGENSLLAVVKPWYVRDTEDGGWKPAYPYDGESIEDFEKRMEAAKGRGDAIQPKRELKLDKFVNPMHRPQHIIKLKIGGVDKAIMVKGNPAFAKAVMHSYSSSDSIRWLRNASRVVSNMFTTYSINFSGKNLMRDTIYSWVSRNIKEDKHYRKTYARNWRRNFGLPMVRLAKEWESGELQQKSSLTPREQLFIDFMHDGGQTGYTVIRSVKDIVKDLERQVKHAGKRSIFRDADGKIIIPGLTHYARLVSTLNEGFELLTRFTTYQTSREMGRSGQSAASDAKEVSVNFNRRGMQSGEHMWGGLAAYLGASHYFFNAGVQGFENFLRLFKIDPPKMTATTAAYALLGMVTPLVNSLIQGALGGDGDDDDDVDEEMREKRKEWDKDWYWNVPDWARRQSIILGFKKFYFAIPLPVELRAFYGIGDVTAKAFLYNKMARRTAGHVIGEYLQTAAEILPVNPIEGAGQVKDPGDWQGWTNVIGRVAAPDLTMFVVDFMTNRDYTGRPLAKENPFTKTKPRSQSAYSSTPKAIEDACLWIAKQTGFDVPPGYVRDFLNSFGGGLYRTAEDIVKLVDTDADRPRRWDNVPFFSGFTGHIDEDRSNSFALDALNEYKDISESNVRRINQKTGQNFSMTDVYEFPEAVLNKIPSVIDKAAVRKIMDSEDYQIGKTYREYMNNKYKMKQSTRDGHWYKSKEVERTGLTKLRKAWQDTRSEWYALPDGTPEKADAYAALQTAWQKYYDASMNLADLLMDMEFGEE